MEAYARLPKPGAIAALEAAGAKNVRLGAGAGIVAAPGTQSLIQLLPRLLPAKKVAILGFTYAEHEAVWAASGAEVKICPRLDDLAEADAAVIVNPNNPDGRRVDMADLRALARHLTSARKKPHRRRSLCDFLPREASLAPHLPLPGVVVLRSFGKTFGLAGLRLGFALGEAERDGAAARTTRTLGGQRRGGRGRRAGLCRRHLARTKRGASARGLPAARRAVAAIRVRDCWRDAAVSSRPPRASRAPSFGASARAACWSVLLPPEPDWLRLAFRMRTAISIGWR